MSENAKYKEKLKNILDKEAVRINNGYKEEIIKLNYLKKAAISNTIIF